MVAGLRGVKRGEKGEKRRKGTHGLRKEAIDCNPRGCAQALVGMSEAAGSTG